MLEEFKGASGLNELITKTIQRQVEKSIKKLLTPETLLKATRHLHESNSTSKSRLTTPASLKDGGRDLMSVEEQPMVLSSGQSQGHLIHYQTAA